MTLTVHTVSARVPWEGTRGRPEIPQKDEAPRRDVRYLCAREDCPFSPFTVPLAAEAVAPPAWDCRCGGEARLEGATEADVALRKLAAGTGKYERVRDGKSSRVYLAERRSDAELEDILAERLAAIRGVTP